MSGGAYLPLRAPFMVRSVHVLLFASAREAVGRPRLERAVPPGGVPLRELLEGLGREYPALRALLGSCREALNGRYVHGRSVRVRPGDELAIHPPFSGG